MNRRVFLYTAAAAVPAVAAAVSSGELRRTPLPRNPVVPGATAVACDLYGKIRDKSGNLSSRRSASPAGMAMTTPGRSADTLAEMTKTLHLPADQPTLTPVTSRSPQDLTSCVSRASTS